MLLIALLAIDYRMFHEVLFGRDALRTNLRRRAERVAGYRPFLEGVRARTRNGDTIAIIVGARDPRVYGYALIRASYVLAGRSLVKMMNAEGAFQPRDVNAAQYLAVFGMDYRGGGTVVWRGEGGVLVRQR